MRNRLQETRFRTILRAISWRIVAFIITVSVAWFVTHRADVAASVGLGDVFIKIVAHYIHERLWLRVSFGQPDYEI